MIPKTIHYCWFGGKPLPKRIKKNIDGWRKINPEFEIIQWDENNFPYKSFVYTKEAYECGKYAFVSDVARLYALYQHGGIYLDTDIEAIKCFDDLINLDFFMGDETNELLCTAVIGSSRENSLVANLIKEYDDIHFLEDGKMDLTTNVERITPYVKNTVTMTYDNDKILLFSSDYFSPKSYSTGEIMLTENTYTIHHFNCSWYSTKDKIKAYIRKFMGPKLFYRLVELKKLFSQ